MRYISVVIGKDYAAFNAPFVGHKDDESQAQSSARIVHQVTACLHASLSSCVYR